MPPTWGSGGVSGADQALAWWLEPLDRGVKSVFRAISCLGNATLYLVGSALAVLWFRFVRRAAAIAAAAFLLALLVPRLTALLTAIALTVAASRLLIGFHYPSDVLAGLVLGLMIPLYLRDWFGRRPWWREPPGRGRGAGRDR